MAGLLQRIRAFWHAHDLAALQAERDELARLLSTAETRTEQLECAVEARERFIAVVGHEMRNPMAPITLGIERLSQLIERGDHDRLRLEISRLGRAAENFMRRATQLLDITRFSAGKYNLSLMPVDVSAVATECVERFADVAHRAGCPVDTRIAPGIVFNTDQPSLEQILENLLSNAFKYGQGQPVSVGLTLENGVLQLEIADQGIGISPEDKARIFEPFERALQNSSRTGGFGVGLWIVGQLTAALGGRIAVTSALGEGTQFRIVLPWRDLA